jgi:hypothetical protein
MIILSIGTVCASVGSGNNKKGLIGMQLPEKYKDNFSVSSEGFCPEAVVAYIVRPSRNVEVLLVFFK